MQDDNQQLHLLKTERAFTKRKKYNEPRCRNTLDEPRKTSVSGRSRSISRNPPMGSEDLKTRGCPTRPGCDLRGRSFQIWIDMRWHQSCLLGPGPRCSFGPCEVHLAAASGSGLVTPCLGDTDEDYSVTRACRKLPDTLDISCFIRQSCSSLT